MATQYAEADQDVISYRNIGNKLVLEKYRRIDKKGLSALELPVIDF